MLQAVTRFESILARTILSSPAYIGFVVSIIFSFKISIDELVGNELYKEKIEEKETKEPDEKIKNRQIKVIKTEGNSR